MRRLARTWVHLSLWQRGIYLLLVLAGLAAYAQGGLGLGEYVYALAFVGGDLWRRWKGGV